MDLVVLVALEDLVDQVALEGQLCQQNLEVN